MHEVLVNRLGGLSLPRKSVVRLTDRPDMTLDVYRGRKTTIYNQPTIVNNLTACVAMILLTKTSILNRQMTMKFKRSEASISMLCISFKIR